METDSGVVLQMKFKFSLNRLLHNDRFILAVALIGAIVVWALVSFGPSNIMPREVTAQVTVDLANTMAGYNDLRVIGEDTFVVSVQVEGPRSVVFNLTGNDIQIRPDLSNVQGPGEAVLMLSAYKSGKATNYEIVDIYPREVTVNCDYWISRDFLVSPDTSSITVADEKTQQIGDVVLDTAAIPDGIVRLEGPRAVMDTIASVVAKVEETATLEKTKRFSADLLALDAQGAQVDLSDCTFVTPADGKVDLTVPVWVQRKVPLTYELLHAPEGLGKNVVSLSMDTITLIGEEEELDRVAATVADLGVIDFDRLLPEEAEMTVYLKNPTNVRVLEGDEVTVTLSVGNYTTKKITYSVGSIEDVVVENLPEGKTLTLQNQKLTDIVLCGPTAVLQRIKAEDLRVTLDAGSSTATGSVRYDVRIDVPKYSNVWVYYGESEQDTYKLYGTIE